MNNNYKIGHLLDKESFRIVIYTDNHQVIASANLRLYDKHNFLEVDGPFARPGFGTLLYQSLAKFAYLNNCYIISARDGDTREGAYRQWAKFFNSVSDSFIKTIPDELNHEVFENFFDKDADPLIRGYKLPVSDYFQSQLIDIEKSPERAELKKLLLKGDEYFGTCYELGTNKWIDKEYSLDRANIKPQYPLKLRIPITDVKVDKSRIEETLRNIEDGHISRTKRPIDLAIDLDGDTIFIDGHHRYVETLLMGNDYVDVVINGNEYLDGFMEEIHRPNKSELFQPGTSVFKGLETIRDIDSLSEIMKEYKKGKLKENGHQISADVGI